MDGWEEIKKLYQDKFNIPPRIVDLIAVDEILQLTCYGLSCNTIANRLDTDVPYIHEVLKEFLNIEGWDYDLDFSPWHFYTRCQSTYWKYIDDISVITDGSLAMETAIASFIICDRYALIRKEIEENYGD